MYTGTLTEVTDPFINAFVNENYNFMINSLRNNFYLNESDGDRNIIEPNNASATKSKMQKFIDWIKKNLWHKPRAWIAKILTRLNHFAANVVYLEEIKPFERSIWSKIKEYIAAAIVWVTNKLENFIRPDKIGKRKNENSKSLNFEELENEVNNGRKYIKFKGPTPSEKRNYIIHKHQIKSWDDIEERRRLIRLDDMREIRAMQKGEASKNIYDIR